MRKLFIKKWVFLGAIIIFTLVMGLKTSIGFFSFFFWLLVSIVFLSLIWILTQYLGLDLEITRRLSAKIQAGDVLEISLTFKNKGFLPVLNLVIEDCLPCAVDGETQKRILLEYVPSRVSVNLKYQCLCPLRGRYTLGPFKVYFFDPLSLFFLRKTYFVYSKLYVFPKTFAIKKFPLLTKGSAPWFGIETAHSGGDEDEFYGVREYRRIDPIKRIHWLTTARKNRLIVKQFQRQSFPQASIIFSLQKERNFGEAKETIAEYTITIAASCARHLLEKNISLEIIAHTGEIVHIPANKGPEQLEKVFQFLAVCAAESKVNVGEVFEEFSCRIPDNSTLIVIMPDKDWPSVSLLLPLQKRNISLIPVILISSSFLRSFDAREVIRDVRIKLSQALHLNPIIIMRQDNLETSFLEA